MFHFSPRRVVPVLGVTLLIALSACGGGSSASKVATLNGQGAATTTTISAKSTQDAFLAYAACMRQNGVDMQDPTFDANGNMTGGGIGRDSGIDRTSTAFQTAQTACGSLIQGINFGGRDRGNFDRTAIQTAMNDYTACLRKQGLDVADMALPTRGGGNNGGSIPIGDGGGAGGGDGGGPTGSFNGPPPSFDRTNNPGGAGFDPTKRMIERLGLDQTDPKVVAAMTACQPILDTAFTNASTTTTAG